MAQNTYTGNDQAKDVLLNKIQPDLTTLFGTKSEVETARGSSPDLDTRLNDISSDLNDVETEVQTARGVDVSLDERLSGIDDDITLLGNAELPGQTGNSGKFLTTNGVEASWGYTQTLDATLAEKTIFNPSSIDKLASVRLSDAVTLFAFNDSTLNVGRAVAVTWGVTISVSSPLTFDSSAVDDISLCQLNSTDAFISYVNPVGAGFANIIKWNGSDLSLETTKFTWIGSNAGQHDCDAITDSIIAVAYYSIGTTQVFMVVIDWDGSNLSVNTASTVIANSNTLYLSVIKVSGGASNAQIAVSVTPAADSGWNVKHVYWSGSAITTPHTYTKSSYSNQSSLLRLSDNSFVAVVKDANSTETRSLNLLVFYHAGGSADAFKLVGIYQLYPASYTPVMTKDSLISMGGNRCVFAATLNTDDLVLLSTIEIIAGSTRVSTTIELAKQQQVNRGANEVCIAKAGSEQIFLGYYDSENSDYGAVEKVELQ